MNGLVENSLLGQQLSKWTLAAGVLTIAMGGLILAWPGPSILVASSLLRVYLPPTGFIEQYLAFTLTRSAGINTTILCGICRANVELVNYGDLEHFGPYQALLAAYPGGVRRLLEWALSHFDIARRCGMAATTANSLAIRACPCR